MIRNILVVEDDRDIGRLIELHLHDLNYAVRLVHDGEDGLREALSQSYDLLILDLMLPGIDGLELCRRLRAQPTYTPILMLTAKSAELDRVLGLEVGADDYLTKPFGVRELLARVKALCWRAEAFAGRAAAGTPKHIRAGALCIDVEKRKVTVGGAPKDLTAKEFDLLLHFAEHPGRVYTRIPMGPFWRTLPRPTK
jgi:DNA-binding response OmpR family regulator